MSTPFRPHADDYSHAPRLVVNRRQCSSCGSFFGLHVRVFSDSARASVGVGLGVRMTSRTETAASTSLFSPSPEESVLKGGGGEDCSGASVAAL